VKRWKRDLGIVRSVGPDTPAFDEVVQRVWDHVEALEEECRRLGTIIEDRRRLALGAALDDTQRELERLRGLPRTATGWQNRAEAAEAELERVKAERDEQQAWIDRVAEFSTEAATATDAAEARLDKALAAFREAEAVPESNLHVFLRSCLAEIEGEAPEKVQPWNRPDWPERSGL